VNKPSDAEQLDLIVDSLGDVEKALMKRAEPSSTGVPDADLRDALVRGYARAAAELLQTVSLALSHRHVRGAAVLARCLFENAARLRWSLLSHEHATRAWSAGERDDANFKIDHLATPQGTATSPLAEPQIDQARKRSRKPKSMKGLCTLEQMAKNPLVGLEDLYPRAFRLGSAFVHSSACRLGSHEHVLLAGTGSAARIAGTVAACTLLTVTEWCDRRRLAQWPPSTGAVAAEGVR